MEHLDRLDDEIARLRAENARLRAALQEIADSDCHAVWCYAPHGTRPCSCHIADAKAALGKETP